MTNIKKYFMRAAEHKSIFEGEEPPPKRPSGSKKKLIEQMEDSSDDFSDSSD